MSHDSNSCSEEHKNMSSRDSIMVYDRTENVLSLWMKEQTDNDRTKTIEKSGCGF